MKHLRLTVFCFYFVFSGQVSMAKGVKYELYGTVTGSYKGNIYLFFEDNYKHKDSLSCMIKDGEFKFTGVIDETPVLARLFLEGYSLIADFYMINGKTSISCEAHPFINGSDTMNIINILKYDASKTENLKMELQDSLSVIDHLKADDTVKQEGYYRVFNRFITKYPKDKSGAYLLGNYMPLLFYTGAMELSSKFDLSLKKSYEFSVIQKELKKSKVAMLRKEGSEFHDFSAKDTSGNLIDTRQYRGKYLMIVCWASWCVPCRKEHPALNGLYEKYLGKDFVILGFSLDFEKDKDAWRRAIRADKLKWPQVSETKGADNEIWRYYDLEGEGIPFNFLVDREGKLIGTQLPLDQIDKILGKEFSRK